jgi:hypothetical protein
MVNDMTNMRSRYMSEVLTLADLRSPSKEQRWNQSRGICRKIARARMTPARHYTTNEHLLVI